MHIIAGNDPDNKPREVAVDMKGAIDVNVQDQTTEVVDLLLSVPIQLITIVTDTVLYQRTITIAAGQAPVAGSLVCLKENQSFYQGFIITVTPNGGDWDVELDSPLDAAFTILGGCTEREANLAKFVGSAANPIIASISPAGLVDTDWHLTRFMGTMVHKSNGLDTLFGSLAALTYGALFRRVNGKVKNLFNAKTNGDFKLRMYDVDYTDAVGGTLRGTTFRRSLNGKDKNGVVQELIARSGDTFELVIQDDLTADSNELASLYCCVQGHVVQY